MKVLRKNLKKSLLKLQLENLDDLWHLYNVLECDDLLYSLTYRREEKAKDKLRPERAEKKRMRLGVRVTNTGFQDFSDRLRVHGIIEEGPQNLGKHHTFNLTIGDKLTIVKPWKLYQLDRIKEAVSATKTPEIMFVSIDYEGATLALLRQQGVQELAKIYSYRSGKRFKLKDSKPKFYREVLSKVERYKVPVILVGPGFAKEEFFALCKEKIKILAVISTGNAGMRGVQEVLAKGLGRKALQESRVMRETLVVEKLLLEISKDGLAVYGDKETRDALQMGAVKNLLVTDRLLKAGKAEELFMVAREKGAEYMIISTVHEAGEKLKSLGGIGGLLRYRVSV